MKKWFNDLFNKWSGIKKEYKDYYQIRKITLVDGTNKYYAEYKASSLDNWSQLFKLATDKIDLKALDPLSLVNDTNYYFTEEDDARELIIDYKADLLVQRAKDFSSEEIIKVD